MNPPNSKPVSIAAELGNLARQQRKQLGLALKDVSKNAGLGIRFLSEFERGKETAELGKVLKTLESLGLELSVRTRNFPASAIADIKADYVIDSLNISSLPESQRPESYAALAELLEHFNVSRLSLFGSAARGEMTTKSDLDFLVEFRKDKSPSLTTLIRLQDALSEHFDGRKVDIATTSVLRNPYRRQQIMKDLRTVYVA